MLFPFYVKMNKNRGLLGGNPLKYFIRKIIKITSLQLQRLQHPHPLPELPHTHRYEQQLHPQV
mgnify:CR=1 FL=1